MSRSPRSRLAPRVVPVSLGDEPMLAAIHAASFPSPWTAADFALFLSQPGMSAWATGAKMASGFILVRKVADEAEVLTLAVLPAQRRRGFARALLAHAAAELRDAGSGCIYLEVAAQNAPALGLYRSLGFVSYATRRNYYRATASTNGRDAIMMRLDL